MSDQIKWVLWERRDGAKYTLRRGRYRSKTAAEDAVKSLRMDGVEILALPDGKMPQANLKSKAPSASAP